MQPTTRLLNDKVLIKICPTNEQTDSGIIAVENISTVTTPMIGIIKAVGPGKRIDRKLIPVEVRPGQKVVIPKWAGELIEVGDDQYVMIRETDILAVIE